MNSIICRKIHHSLLVWDTEIRKILSCSAKPRPRLRVTPTIIVLHYYNLINYDVIYLSTIYVMIITSCFFVFFPFKFRFKLCKFSWDIWFILVTCSDVRRNTSKYCLYSMVLSCHRVYTRLFYIRFSSLFNDSTIFTIIYQYHRLMFLIRCRICLAHGH